MSRWFYSLDGKDIVGPISQDELIYLIGQGRLNKQTIVCEEGMSEWVYASTVDRLFPQNVPPYPPINSSNLTPKYGDAFQTPPLPSYNVPSPSYRSEVPSQIKGWNWGAFVLAPIWSIGNQVWIGLLSFIPYVGFIVSIYLGVKGNELAWKSKKWQSVEQFKSTQRGWAIAGFILLVLSVLIGIAIGASSS